MATVADNRVAEAVDVVARWSLAVIIDDFLNWDYFPDLDEDDFDDVFARARKIADRPSHDEYLAAFDFLASRPDNTEATP